MRQLPQPDPRGVLALTGLDDEQQAAEDARHIADADIMASRRGFAPVPGVRFRMIHSAQDDRAVEAFTRPATTTERDLLEQLGYTLPDELVTAVHFRTGTTRFRFFPQLEQETTHV